MVEIAIFGSGILIFTALIRVAKYMEQVEYERRKFYNAVSQELSNLENLARLESEITEANRKRKEPTQLMTLDT